MAPVSGAWSIEHCRTKECISFSLQKESMSVLLGSIQNDRADPGEYEMQHVFVELLTDQSLQFCSSISHRMLSSFTGSTDHTNRGWKTAVQNAEEEL